jgi:cell division protein FtsW
VRNAAALKARPAPAVRAFISTPPDAVLISSIAILVGIGLVMIFSASSALAFAVYHDPTYYLKRQVLWLAVALAVAYGAYRIDYHKLKAISPLLFVLSVASLIVVLIPHVGIVVNTSRRWLGTGSLSIEPSEFAKLALVLFLAAKLSSRGDRITSLVRGLFPLCLAIGLVVMLVLREPDMGTASLLAMVAFAMLFAAGARIEHLGLIFLSTVPLVALAVLADPYKRARALAFLNPWKDPQNTGFHIVQSLLALGSGGIFGVGLGASRAKFFYLPEQYTDFIFAVLGEELGLIGAVGVILLFVIFAHRAVRIALSAPDRFGFFLTIGCTALIVLQAFLNIGVVTSSWPVTGVPLPFISFGGSSLVVCLAAVALIVNVGRHRRLTTP